MKAVLVTAILFYSFVTYASLERCKEIYKQGVQLRKTEYNLMKKCRAEIEKICKEKGCKIGSSYICMEALISTRLKLLKEFNQLQCWNQTEKTGL